MTALVLCWCLSTEIAPAAGAPARERFVSVLERTQAYRDRQELEQVFVGVLEANPGAEKGRLHPFRLRSQNMNGATFRLLLYAPGKSSLFDRRLGQQVRITGRVVTTEADGRSYRELWPGRLEEISNPLARGAGKDGVIARCAWQPEEARRLQARPGVRCYVFRDGKQLAEALRLSGETADRTAAVMLARQLGVPEIDWKKYMLVTVCAGLRVSTVGFTVVEAAREPDGTLRVRYRSQRSPREDVGISFPAETVLVQRHDGAVRAEEAPSANKPGK